MVLIDTNILLNSVNRDSFHHEESRDCLDAVANGSERWCMTWSIMYEFLRVATHPRVFQRPLDLNKAHSFLSNLFESNTFCFLSETDEHQMVLRTCLNELPRLQGNILHDLHIAVIMREHAVEDIITRDKDFRLFSWINNRIEET